MTNKQPTIDELFNKIELPELNNKIDEFTDDKVMYENIETLDIKKVITNLNGIVEVVINNVTYKTWMVELIKPHIIKFLEHRYLDSLIVFELNNIDITVIIKKTDEIIPSEIQKTVINKKSSTRTNSFHHSHFEGSVRKQITDNIENYGKCLLFIDSEYLRYLQSGDVKDNTSIDMTWLVKYMKENKLEIFAIKYDGIIRELTTNDFNFLKKMSQVCEIGYNNDDRILNRNKLKIFRNVVLGNSFVQREINNFYKIFNERIEKSIQNSASFFIKYGNERCKLYGYILQAIGDLKNTNSILNMNCLDIKHKQSILYLGIFDVIHSYGNCKGNIVKFVDKFDICKYFPGYIRNKEQWESYRNTNLTHSTFTMIANGSLKFNKTMMDY